MTAVEIIKEAGPYVVGLAGIAVGYFGGGRTGRETRHHARVEALYQEMLDDMAYQSRRALDAVGIMVYGQGPPGPEVPPVKESRVRLYASPSVAEAWNDALFYLHVLDVEGRAKNDDHVTQATFKVHAAERILLAAMRDDLGVPKGSLWARVRRRVQAYAKGVAWWRATRRRRRRRAMPGR